MADSGKTVEKAMQIGANPELFKQAQEMVRTKLGKGEAA
jgi:hypothetical protein